MLLLHAGGIELNQMSGSGSDLLSFDYKRNLKHYKILSLLLLHVTNCSTLNVPH